MWSDGVVWWRCMGLGLRIFLIILVLVGLFVGYYFVSLSSGGFGRDHIIIGVPNWESATGTAYILGNMLERDFDVVVRFEPRTNEEIYAGIADGSVHVHPEGWFPNHANWHNQFADALDRNLHMVSATQGLCVDRSLAEQYGVFSVDDLLVPEKAALFDNDGDGLGEGWIGVEGWGATPIEQIRAKSYGYDKTFELMVTEEAEAFEQFNRATANGKMFLLYCYTPHWMWHQHHPLQLEEPEYDPDKWDVVFPSESQQWLEESNVATGWEPASLNVYFAASLEEKHPDIAAFLREVRFTEEELLDIAHGVLQQSADLRQFAQEWVSQHR